MPYCTKCGAPVREDDKFCPVCGAPVAKFTREEFTVSGSNLVDRVRDLLHEGNVNRIIDLRRYSAWQISPYFLSSPETFSES